LRRRFYLVIALLLFGAAPAGAYVRGVDVSHYRGKVNWARVHAGGYRFTFAEATNGFLPDWTYATNRAGSERAGMAFGAFHVADPHGRSTAAIVADAVDEADFFVTVAQPRTGELAPVLDLERTGGLSAAGLRTWTSAWLDEVWHQVGARPTIYASPSFWRHAMRDASVFATSGSRLWIAHWHVRSPRVPAADWAATGWSFWQWTDCSHVPGVRGCADGDVFNGTRMASAAMAAPPVSIDPPTITGVPQAGQLLSAADGTWTANPTPTLSYSWERCTDTTADDCVAIPKATTSTYTVTPADVGSTLRVVVAATSRARTAWASSTAVPVNG
jgi:GH25 family lysozyme M1 (1,4-beta-N-acetylmuramidase)